MKKDRNKNGSGKKSGKGLKIAGAVLIVFIPVQLFVMGWFGGLGPFKGMKDVRMGNIRGMRRNMILIKFPHWKTARLPGNRFVFSVPP